MHRERGDRKIDEGEPLLRNPVFPSRVTIENKRNVWEQAFDTRDLKWIGDAQTAYVF